MTETMTRRYAAGQTVRVTTENAYIGHGRVSEGDLGTVLQVNEGPAQYPYLVQYENFMYPLWTAEHEIEETEEA